LLISVGDPEVGRQYAREVCNGVPNKITPGGDADEKAENAASMKFRLQKYDVDLKGLTADELNSSCLVDDEVCFSSPIALLIIQFFVRKWKIATEVSLFLIDRMATGLRKSELHSVSADEVSDISWVRWILINV
jgi:hypothetical protein